MSRHQRLKRNMRSPQRIIRARRNRLGRALERGDHGLAAELMNRRALYKPPGARP